MVFRAWALFGLLLGGACHSSNSVGGHEDSGVQDVSVLDASVQDSGPGADATTCRGPVDWRVDVPLAAFMHASATVDGWRISGAAEAPLDASTSWLADRDGTLSTRTTLVDAPWGAGGNETFAGDSDGSVRIGRIDEAGEAEWRGEYRHGQTMRTLSVVEDGRAAYVVGTLRDTDGDQDTLVARFDETGILEWAQVLDRGGSDSESSNTWVIGAFIDAAGRLVVANSLYRGGGVAEAVPLWVFALSAGGDLAWEHFQDGYDPASSWGFVHDDDGMFLVGTLAHFDIRGGLQTTRLGAEGDVLWTTLVDDGSERRHNARAALPTPDGGYLMAGQINGAVGEAGASARIWKLNDAGELLWTSTPGEFRTSFTNMVPFEGGYILKSTNRMDERTWWAFLAIDQDGEILWRHDEEVLSNSSQVMNMVPNGRGQVLAVGHSTAGGVRNATALQFGQRCR